MKTRTSITTISGKDTKVTHTEPTLDEIIEAIGKERSAKIIVDYTNRHHFLPAMRDAGDVLSGKTTFESEVTKARRTKEAQELMTQVASDTVFDILDFIPEGRGGKPTKADLEVAEAAYAALEAGTITEAQLTASYQKVGLEFKTFSTKEEFVTMHANKKRVERAQAGKSLA